MEIVVNKCFGGFGISQLALRKLIKMNSEIVKIMPVEEYFGEDNVPDFDNDLGYDKVKLKYLFDGEYYYEKFMNHILYKEGMVYSLMDRYEDGLRTHKDLIKVVKELGDEANGRHAELGIVEIPDGVDWEIDDYDGIETIHEKHRSW